MKTIFAVDDDKGMLELLAKCLSQRGYELACTDRVTGAFNSAKPRNPSMFMLDVMLPDGAGYQIARQVRQDPNLYRVPILFASAFADGPEVDYALRQGGDEYLAKPFSLAQFLAKLDALERLAERISRPDPCSGLRGTEAFDKELDHAIFRGIPFVFCHFTITNFKGFSLARQKEDADSVIRWTSDLLTQTATDMQMTDARLCHLGAGHFGAIFDTEHYRKYCQAVSISFKQGIRKFYKEFELQQGYSVSVSRPGTFEATKIMRLHITAARSEEHAFTHARDVRKRFEKVEEEEVDSKPLFQFRQSEKW